MNGEVPFPKGGGVGGGILRVTKPVVVLYCIVV